MAASSEAAWLKLISGDESGADVGSFLSTPTAVFAFKDERPANFDIFAMLISATSLYNMKEFELLQGNESPTGVFQSIGKFQARYEKLFNRPYQEFQFSPVTAKYLKVEILSTYSGSTGIMPPLQLFGVLQ